jgi:hypothetical protein
MSFQGDPHRTLGIAPGASLNEIKSAYRRLVKQYHPDAAGERALPRFLAIQGAYERLVDGEGRLRQPSTARTTRREPWRADPSRPRASRDAWRARRSGSGSAAGASGTAGGSGPRAAGASNGGAGDAGAPPNERPRRERSSREHHARRGPRRATPGSTSYDEAAEPLDPDWDGGAWYGPSSGTYWTINPREYADPRKHGPEYQARARRAARGQPEDSAPGVGPEPTIDEAAASAAAGAEPSWNWRTDERADEGPAGSTTSGGAEWGTRSWRYDDVPPAAAPGGRRPGRRTAASPSPEPAPLPDLESLAMRAAPRNLLGVARRDARARLVLALVGWPPIGYALATLLTELTGCAAFAASCPEPVPVITLAVQPLVVAGLFALAPAAAVAAFASIVALAVALPVAAILSVGSGPDARVGAGLLGFTVAGAYLVGLAWGTHAVWRAPRDTDAGGSGGTSPGT